MITTFVCRYGEEKFATLHILNVLYLTKSYNRKSLESAQYGFVEKLIYEELQHEKIYPAAKKTVCAVENVADAIKPKYLKNQSRFL